MALVPPEHVVVISWDWVPKNLTQANHMPFDEVITEALLEVSVNVRGYQLQSQAMLKQFF